MGKTRVLRGEIQEFQYGGAVNVIQDDQRFNHGFIIKDFRISSNDPGDSTAGSRDCFGVLATHADAVESKTSTTRIGFNWGDRRQVAWTSTNHIGDSVLEWTDALIDPTHVVVRDLYVAITAGSATSTRIWCYYIELEEVALTDNQAVLAIVQEEAQDVN